MAHVSIREYAKLRGVSHTAVQKAIRSGRLAKAIVRQDEKITIIDSELADVEWPKGMSGQEVETRVGMDPEPQPQGVTVDKVASTYQQSRAAREAFNAKLAKLEFDEKSGRLVSAEEVKAEAFKRARSTRDAMLNIPDRVSAELAVETDQFKVHARLKEEILKALESLVQDQD